MLLLCAKTDEKKKGFDVKAFEKSLRSIPAGTLTYADSSWVSLGKIKGRTVNVSPFYLCDHVVTNKEYRAFLGEIRFSDPQLYTKMYPDTLVWFHHEHAFGEAMTNMYFWHPGYDSYPVVGVSHEQAECYCKWLTDEYTKDPNRKFKNAKVCLPDVYQWEWAAHGGHNTDPFPWPGTYVRNDKGLMMANFMGMPDCAFKRVNDTGKLEFAYSDWPEGPHSDYGKSLMPYAAISYWPNDYGLYNMAGNVSEYVSEIGITKGGNWNDPGYYIQIWIPEHYENAQSTSDRVGFRIALEEGK